MLLDGLGFLGATQALERALLDGLDLGSQPPRHVVDVRAGQLLLMASEIPGAIGVKIAAVAPGNPARGVDRIQAIALVIDSETLRPRALLDGVALTTLRTPALSAVAARRFRPDFERAVIFGSGPQAWGHAHALAAIAPEAAIWIVARDAAKADPLVQRLRGEGIQAQAGSGSHAVADIIVCATSARTPVFDGRAVADHALVIAVGSHEPDAREVDTAFVRRATVIVEDVPTALREAGDIIIPIAEGALDAGALLTLQQMLREPGAVDGPVLFKSVGMAWEDLVVAEAALSVAG